MKAISKQQMADKAGVSLNTFRRWCQPFQADLEAMGVNPNARLLEDIRKLFLEVVPTIPSAPVELPKPKTLTAELTEEQKQKQDAAALEFLKGF